MSFLALSYTITPHPQSHSLTERALYTMSDAHAPELATSEYTPAEQEMVDIAEQAANEARAFVMTHAPAIVLGTVDEGKAGRARLHSVLRLSASEAIGKLVAIRRAKYGPGTGYVN